MKGFFGLRISGHFSDLVIKGTFPNIVEEKLPREGQWAVIRRLVGNCSPVAGCSFTGFVDLCSPING